MEILGCVQVSLIWLQSFRSKAEQLPTVFTYPFIPCCSSRQKLLKKNNNKKNYTCRPMTHCPAFIFSSSNILSCLSAYFTPMSTRGWQPLVLAWRKKNTEGCKDRYKSNHTPCNNNFTLLLGQHYSPYQSLIFFLRLTMLASASSVVWTCVMLPFSNRSLASKMSWGFRP